MGCPELMNGEKMTTTKKDGAKRVTQKAKIAALVEENVQLREANRELIAVGAEQLRRLVDQTLLQSHLVELQQQLRIRDD